MVNVKTQHLRYFLEVALTRNFTNAAENLYITQPALSRIIKSLEEEIGAPLFIRSRKKLLLTDAGHVLEKHAKIIHQQIDLLHTDLDYLLTLKKGHIRIGLPSIINSFFFSEILSTFHQKYPEVTFQLEEDGSKGIEEKIVHNQLDIGVVVFSGKGENIEYFTFVNEKLKLFVPSSHRLVGEKNVALEKLKTEKFIMFNQDFEMRNLVLTACEHAGFRPEIISETSQLDFIEEMVAYNLGITLLPESTGKELTSEIKTIPIVHPTIEWNLALIWKKDDYLSPLTKEFIQFAKTKLMRIKHT